MDSPRMKFMDEAAAKRPTTMGRMFATTVVVCATLVVIMVTIKMAMMLFG